MIYVIYTIHVVVCLFLILVVLLQQGKGADLSVFGGGSTQTAFGARGAATLLHKLTVGSFVFFILTTLTIALYQGSRHERGSVMTGAQQEVPVPGEEAEAPAAGGAAAEAPPAGAAQEVEDSGSAAGETPQPAGEDAGDGGGSEPPG